MGGVRERLVPKVFAKTSEALCEPSYTLVELLKKQGENKKDAP